MILYHFSLNEDLGVLHDVKQSPRAGFKPNGFWLSDEDGDPAGAWSNWCEGESWGDIEFQFRHTIEVDTSRMLLIQNSPELIAFNDEYGAKLDPSLPHGFDYIDWGRVAGRYAGILISPYQWAHRLDPAIHWYYGWDCASGCVWDASVMTVLKEAQHG